MHLASGFRLQSLKKLLDVKTVDGKETFLDFLVDWVAKEAPEALDFDAELSDVAEAVKVKQGTRGRVLAEGCGGSNCAPTGGTASGYYGFSGYGGYDGRVHFPESICAFVGSPPAVTGRQPLHSGSRPLRCIWRP